VLFDGNAMEGTHGAGLKTAILQAQQMPHALPGKVVIVGFSLGGGMDLFYGSQWSDLVLGGVVWYPANAMIQDVSGWASRLQVPLLVFAGERDHFRDNCCTADKDRILLDAAKSADRRFELITYPDADHDFVKDGAHYKPHDYDDAFQRMAERIKAYFAE